MLGAIVRFIWDLILATIFFGFFILLFMKLAGMW